MLKFGEITKRVVEAYGLKIIAEIVQQSEDKKVKVLVLRGEQELVLDLVPSKWKGKGLLG